MFVSRVCRSSSRCVPIPDPSAHLRPVASAVPVLMHAEDRDAQICGELGVGVAVRRS